MQGLGPQPVYLDTTIGRHTKRVMTKFQSVRGVKFWDKSTHNPISPPSVCTLPGRPKEKRVCTEEINRRVRNGVAIQKSWENAQHPQTVPDILPTHGKVQRCSFCHEEGHYKRTCKKFKEVSTCFSFYILP